MDSVWTEIAKTLGLPAAFFAFIIWAGVKKWWVFGWVWEEEKKRTEEWRDMALTGTHTADIISEFAVQQRASRDAASVRSIRRQSIAEEVAHLPPARPRRLR